MGKYLIENSVEGTDSRDYTLDETRGNPIYSIDNENYFYWEDDSPWYCKVEMNIENQKPCIRCGRMPTEKGHDACLGDLPGVKSCCCGHGISDPYINFINGMAVYNNGMYTWNVRLDVYNSQYRIKYGEYMIGNNIRGCSKLLVESEMIAGKDILDGEKFGAEDNDGINNEHHTRLIQSELVNGGFLVVKIPGTRVINDKICDLWVPLQPLFACAWKMKPPRIVNPELYREHLKLFYMSDIYEKWSELKDSFKRDNPKFVDMIIPSVVDAMFIDRHINYVKNYMYTSDYWGVVPIVYANGDIYCFPPTIPLDIWPIFIMSMI